MVLLRFFQKKSIAAAHRNPSSTTRFTLRNEFSVEASFTLGSICPILISFRRKQSIVERSSSSNVVAGNGNKTDSFYTLGIVPAVKSKVSLKTRYNLLRNNGECYSAKTFYEAGADYYFTKKHLTFTPTLSMSSYLIIPVIFITAKSFLRS